MDRPQPGSLRPGSLRPGPTLSAALLCLAAAACGDDPAGPASSEAASIEISVDSVRFWTGDTRQLSAEVRAGDGRALSAAVQWSSTTAAVEVDPSGLASAVRRGTGRIEARAGDVVASVPVRSLPVVRGMVHAGSAADLTDLWATWRTASRSVTVPVGADGHFTLRALDLGAGGELEVSAAGGAFLPFLFPFHVDSLVEPVDIVLVPREWTIRNGIYAGQTIDVSLDLVLNDSVPRGVYSYWFGTVDPWPDGDTYDVTLRVFPLENLPVKVAFDHRNSVPAITAPDSAILWQHLDRVEEVFGLDFFEPAIADPEWWPQVGTPEAPPGYIRFGFHPDTNAVGFGAPLSSEEPATWTADLGAWADGGRFRKFRVTRERLDSGEFWLGDFDPWVVAGLEIPWHRVMTHELMHALGTGHTWRIPSTQTGLATIDFSDPTAHDVAYMELLRELMRLEREHDTFLGVIPALIGERMRLLGSPALPSLGLGRS